VPWAVAYTSTVAPWPHPPGVRVHPAALYESLALAAVYGILWRMRGRVGPTGAIFAIYLTAAGAIRFLVEYVRTNRPIALGLTEAQWISLAVAAGAGVWLAAHITRAERGEPQPTCGPIAPA